MEFLHATAESCQINWEIERAVTCGSINFCKDEILQRWSCILGILQLQKLMCSKVLNLRLKFFECTFLTFITLNVSGKTRLTL